MTAQAERDEITIAYVDETGFALGKCQQKCRDF
jgi:hypothetical protein